MSRSSTLSGVRAPRLRAQINGVNVDSVIHAEIACRGSCSSSTFDLTIGITESTLDAYSIGLLTARVGVKIYIYSRGLDVGAPILEGLADSISVDQVNGTARVLGRDYSSVLVDLTFQSWYCNQTASEIALSIADRHGFGSDIVTTSSMTGSYQDGAYNSVLLNAHSRVISEWDLLVRLARQEQFELFFDGATLVFSPAASLPSSNFSIDMNDVTELRFHKRLPLSEQAVFTVKSWNSWMGRAFYYSGDQSPTSIAGGAVDFSDASSLEVAIVRPNLSSQSTQELANRNIDALNERSLTIQITMPGETTMKPRDLLTITGSQSAFDTDYVTKSVRREFSTSFGFIQYIQGSAVGDGSLQAATTGSSTNG